jgi:hypothetical protein
MLGSSLVLAFITLVVFIAFMVACPVLCIIFSIFTDSININGTFEKAGTSFVDLIFIPFVLFFKIIDTITSPFVEPHMKDAIDNINNMR